MRQSARVRMPFAEGDLLKSIPAFAYTFVAIGWTGWQDDRSARTAAWAKSCPVHSSLNECRLKQPETDARNELCRAHGRVLGLKVQPCRFVRGLGIAHYR